MGAAVTSVTLSLVLLVKCKLLTSDQTDPWCMTVRVLLIVVGIVFLSFFLFLLWSGTRSLCMPAQAGPIRNPREGTSVVLRDTTRLT